MIREANLHWEYQDTETNLILPWYTLPALEWLKKQDISQWIVFEYGAGYSTIWFRANCLGVKSVDHSESWSRAMGAAFKADKEEYINEIEFWVKPIGAHFNPDFVIEKSNSNLFDCIVVDGEWREECTIKAKECIADGGYLIFDNYGQEDFPTPEVIDALLEGWEKQVFKQPNHSDWCTAVFKKP